MKVLVVKLSSLGDLFHALPVVHDIRTGLGATIDWVTQPNYADLVRCFDDVARVLTFPRRRFLRAFPEFLRELRAERYDFIVDLQGLLKSALLVSRLARATTRIGPPFSRELARLFYSATPASADPERHAVDKLRDVGTVLGLTPSEPQFPVSFPAQTIEEPAPRVALVPRSRWAAKDWPPANFVQLGKALQQESGATVFLIGARDDARACDEIEAGLTGSVVNLCGRTSLVEMGGVLQAMDLVVSVDSGPMHVAAAAGAPVLAIFGATDPGRTGPYGSRHRVVTPEHLNDVANLARAYKRNADTVPWEVSPENVIPVALEMLPG